MTPELWQKVFALVKATQAQEESQRTAFLAQHCGDDQEIRDAAQSLLHAQEQMGSFLEQPGTGLVFANRLTEQFAFEGDAEATIQATTASSTGTVPKALPCGALLGRYVVLNLLGT